MTPFFLSIFPALFRHGDLSKAISQWISKAERAKRWASERAAIKAEVTQAKEPVDLLRMARAITRLDALDAEIDAVRGKPNRRKVPRLRENECVVDQPLGTVAWPTSRKPARDRCQRIERFVGPRLAEAKLVTGHPSRPKHHMALVIFLPVKRDDTVRLHLVPSQGARIRRQHRIGTGVVFGVEELPRIGLWPLRVNRVV